MIPKRFVRVTPEHVGPLFESWWQQFADLHPGYEMLTIADPIDPDDWPLTGHRHAECVAGAQLAGLVRLEAVYRWGGVYLDADVRPLRSFEPLLEHSCFVGWEDHRWLCDAVFGAEAGHPAILAALDQAMAMDFNAGPGATGPQNLTHALTARNDVTTLPVEALYPCSYLDKAACEDITAETHPESYCVHMWSGSWLTA